MPRRPKPPSQTWRTFLENHLADLASVDFFVVPTATFRVLYVFLVLQSHRRQVVHFNVTDSPSAAWTAQQIVEAFPDDSAPRFLLRDRDSIYGAEFQRPVKSMRIAEILTAAHSPWQNPFAERMIGTIRRELLEHVIVLNEGHLRRRLHGYLHYYHGSRTHLALEKDAPVPRAVEPVVCQNSIMTLDDGMTPSDAGRNVPCTRRLGSRACCVQNPRRSRA
jgi:putative transposase